MLILTYYAKIIHALQKAISSNGIFVHLSIVDSKRCLLQSFKKLVIRTFGELLYKSAEIFMQLTLTH